MDLINWTWDSEIKYSQPCIGFPKYYWLNYTPIVYSEQKIFCHLVNENVIHWLVSVERKSYNSLRSTQQLFSLDHTSTREHRRRIASGPAAGRSITGIYGDDRRTLTCNNHYPITDHSDYYLYICRMYVLHSITSEIH